MLAPAAEAQFSASTVALRSNDIAYDPATELLYASVPSSAGKPYGNSIARIDPVQALVLDSVFIGSEPGRMARTDDGQYLYVSLDGVAAIRRYDIATQAAGPQFAVGQGFFGPSYVEDIDVIPGSPMVIAASMKRLGISPRHDGVAVFDNGIRRALVTPDHTGSNVIESTADPAVLYGLNNETTEFGLRRMVVSDQGVSVSNVWAGFVGGFGADIEFADGVLYATTGAAISTVTNALIGSYAASGPVAVRGNEVYFASSSFFGPVDLRVFNRTTFVPRTTHPVPGCTAPVKRILVVGASKLAIACSDNVVILDNGALFANGFEP